MSGIAGIVHFDGAPIEPGLIENMTASMYRRGPDGIYHWKKDSVALGHCMFRTTPESLAEIQPWANEDESLVLVLDGRVDNWTDLRKNLLGCGIVLRNLSDAELVLRAYELWGEKCLDFIIGEFAFFIWNAREQTLFAGRDAAGTRHFYYYSGPSWFAFASEIKGLLTISAVKPVLNETRLLDYLIVEHDRDDEVGTFYQGINRMPAGHAMKANRQGLKVWRYWDPSNLSALHFNSLDECAEAYLDVLRTAVKCRLRSIGPVGATLSGGLDSTSIVCLIRKEFRGELQYPLRTISLIRDDRENCPDWKHIQEILRGGWIDPAIVTSALSPDFCRLHLNDLPNQDEPYELGLGLPHVLIYGAARDHGCRVLLDGMAADLHFYSAGRSLNAILNRKMYRQLPGLIAAHRRHEFPGIWTTLARRALRSLAPSSALMAYRRHRDQQAALPADIRLLNPDVAKRYLANKHYARSQLRTLSKSSTDQNDHADIFMSGVISYAHEGFSQAGLSMGVEPRSPYSDRRMIEFAIQMPLEAKLCAPWHKFMLRKSMKNILPESARWRRDVGGHPGWKFNQQLILQTAQNAPEIWNRTGLSDTLSPLVDKVNLENALMEINHLNDDLIGNDVFLHVILAEWLNSRQACGQIS